jgi:O-antigen ligase
MFSSLRAGLIGGSLGIILSLFYWNWKRAIPYIVVGAFFTGILVLALPMFKTASYAMVEHTATIDNSALARPVLAGMGLDMWSRSPVLGSGFKSVARGFGPGDAHNTYVNVLADYGLVGIGLFLTVIILAFVRLKQVIPHLTEGREMVIGLMGALLCACITVIFHSANGQEVFWLFPALALSVHRFSVKRTRVMAHSAG